MSVLRTIRGKIPGPVPGIFFLAGVFSSPVVAELKLAADLFEEGQWAEARVEGLRVQQETTGSEFDRARLFAAVSALRMNRMRETAKTDLDSLWQSPSTDREIRCMAAYEKGRADWADGSRSNVFTELTFAYLHTRNVPLFWRSGCSLYFWLKGDKKRRQQEPALWQSLLSCQAAWSSEVWRECRPPKPNGDSLSSLPGKWIVSFYRAQIGPAIGSRCDLLPSCSEYFLQAGRAHGWLGLPLMADRFVREPSVVSAREKPVIMPDGRIRYADPLSDHDAWLTEGSP